MNVQESLQMLDHVSRQTDRWLFLGTLFLLGLFTILVLRHLLKQHGRLVDDHAKARDSYHESLRVIVQEQMETSKQLAVILDRNTNALGDVQQELQHCRHQRERRP